MCCRSASTERGCFWRRKSAAAALVLPRLFVSRVPVLAFPLVNARIALPGTRLRDFLRGEFAHSPLFFIALGQMGKYGNSSQEWIEL